MGCTGFFKNGCDLPGDEEESSTGDQGIHQILAKMACLPSIFAIGQSIRPSIISSALLDDIKN